MQDLVLVFAGFFVGVVVGLTGVGGGSLMTPLLIFGFGIQPVLAIGTDLLFAAITKLGGSVALARARLIDWTVVAQLAAGSVPASVLTLWLIQHMGPADALTQKLMTFTLGVALLLTAAATLYKAVVDRPLVRAHSPVPTPTTPRHWALPLVMGGVIGVLVTLTSVGAGAIGVLALMLLYPALPLRRVVAADIAHAVPLTLVAGLGHAAIGTVNWPLLATLLVGSLPGIWLGTRLANKAPDRLVRSLLSLLLAYAGVKLVAL